MKPRLAFLFLALCVAAGSLTMNSCSLTPSPQALTLNLRLPAKAKSEGLVARHGGRTGPTLSTMKCYGIIARGDALPINSSQVGFREPACLKMDGAFFGPYTHAQLLAGASITLSPGNYSLQLVGYDGIADCGSGLSTMFAATAPDVYDVAVSQSFSFPATTSITLDGTIYNAATTESLTPSCLPQTGDCGGYPICDTFTDTNGSQIGLHAMDTGQFWTSLLDLLDPSISGGHGNVSATVPGGTASTLAMDTTHLNQDILVDFNLGYTSGDITLQIIGRYDVGNNSYVKGYFTQSALNCQAGVGEYVTAGYTDFFSGNLPCSVADASGNVTLRLQVHSTNVRLTVGTVGSVRFDNSGAGPVVSTSGTLAGVGANANGFITAPQTVDVFRARRQSAPWPD